jgi:hypothetical protein
LTTSTSSLLSEAETRVGSVRPTFGNFTLRYSFGFSFPQPAIDIMDQGAQPTPNSSASDEHNQYSAEAAKPLASCDLCRKRKVKCDRGKPCSNCLRSGVACVFSIPSRVPRARIAGQRKPGGEISKRIAKLENLVKYLEAENSKILSTVPIINKGDAHSISEAAVSADANEKQLEGLEATRSSPKNRLDRYLSSSFWVTLSDEVRLLPFLPNQSEISKMRRLMLIPT